MIDHFFHLDKTIAYQVKSPAISPQSEFSREASSPEVCLSKNPISCRKMEAKVSIRTPRTIRRLAYPNQYMHLDKGRRIRVIGVHEPNHTAIVHI